MKIGDEVIFTDNREVEHNAVVTKVVNEPTNIEQTETREICNVVFNNKGRAVNAELIPASDLKEGKVTESEPPAEPEPAPTPEPAPEPPREPEPTEPETTG